MNESLCYAFAEDEPSCAVIKRLVQFYNERDNCVQRLGFVSGFPENYRGVDRIRSKMPAIINMADAGLTVLVLVDLDQTECAPTLLRQWPATSRRVDSMPSRLWLRIAQREVESWVLADRTAFARFLGISTANIPVAPDSLDDPKQHLLNIVRAKCRKKRFRDMLPSRNAPIGLTYNQVLVEFIEASWSPERAAENSASLRKAIEALQRIPH
jgi:hypothetical protein